MAKFNVLKEPWIPVEMLSGEQREMGILDVLENAHKIRTIRDPSPLFEYGMYRLLIVFIMDTFKFENRYDIKNALKLGRFQMDAFYKYVEECEKDGPRFDLFDKKYPFLQSAYDEELDDEAKCVSSFVYEMPSGSNLILAVHKLEHEHSLSPKICARNLTSWSPFAIAGGTGYRKSVNGIPPSFFLVNGETLFEQLLINCMAKESVKIGYNDPPPIWRQTKKMVPDGPELLINSLLWGMTFIPRRVCLIADESGGICSMTGKPSDVVVREIYFQKSPKFLTSEAWTEPHAATFSKEVGPKGQKVIKDIRVVPELGKEMWRHMGEFFDPNGSGIPDVVEIYSKNHRGSDLKIGVTAYELIAKNAKIEAWQCSQQYFNINIAQDSEKVKIATDCIKDAEEIAGMLIKQCTKMGSEMASSSKSKKGGCDDIQASFYAECKVQFETDICKKLALADSDQLYETEPEIVKEWLNWLKKRALNNFNTYADRFGVRGKSLMICAKNEKKLDMEISKIIKRRSVK